MKYIMKAGILYLDDKMCARIKGGFTGPGKTIYSPGGEVLMCTDIVNAGRLQDRAGDISCRKYVLFDSDGKECADASPEYAEGDDPNVVGWPLCRMPRVDHAKLDMGGKKFLLVMQNSQNYSLYEYEKPGLAALQIFHRGLGGGWNIEAAENLAPELICGIFVFCKYIEQENEFLTV